MIPTVKTFFGCLPLRAGCIISGVFLFIFNVMLARDYVETSFIFGNEYSKGNEDKMNGGFMLFYSTATITLVILLAVAGLCVIIAAWMELPELQKFVALYILVNTITSYVVSFLYLIARGTAFQFVLDTLKTGINIYFAIVLWSFYQEMEGN